jgi:hydroxymethylpyrimidine pyrophosphatase-like HAD family hydrolase
VARRLLTVEWPAVIDNRTRLDAFAEAPAGAGLVKDDFDTGVFGSDDLYCFDPASDIALAAVGRDAATGDRLRRAYEAATGRPVEPERWLLHQLVHVLVSQEKQAAASRHTDLRPARLLLHYYREVLLADLEPPASGPLCAIDLDGVLETMPLGFPATSPAGALALRALNRHGYRPVVATGRSLDEVRDRCAAYGLAGGVAEYGAVVYLHDGSNVHSLLEPAELHALERLRAGLSEDDDVHLDPAYRYSVRAFRLDARGQRRALSDERSTQALAACGEGRLRRVRGHYQTDFVAAGSDKARGLRLLAGELGVGPEAPLALAVGDTTSDLEMLRMAHMGIAPGNAEPALRHAGVRTVRRSAQAGLAQAVARLVGHRPGGCSLCAPPRLAASSRLLLDLLGVEDLGRWRQAARALRLLLASRQAR